MSDQEPLLDEPPDPDDETSEDGRYGRLSGRRVPGERVPRLDVVDSAGNDGR